MNDENGTPTNVILRTLFAGFTLIAPGHTLSVDGPRPQAHILQIDGPRPQTLI